MMIGRPLAKYFPSHVHAQSGRRAAARRGPVEPGKIQDVSFALRAGEVLGFAGLVGAGRSEVAQALFGLDGNATGRRLHSRRAVRDRSARQPCALGLGLVPEDRKRQGLVLSMTALENTTLPISARCRALGVHRRRGRACARRTYFERLSVRASRSTSSVAGLSGGNQQKIVLAKWLAARCRDSDPRRADARRRRWREGGDPRADRRLASRGAGVLLISSELPEVLNLCTRIIVLREGRMRGSSARSATQDGLMRLMAGVEHRSVAVASSRWPVSSFLPDPAPRCGSDPGPSIAITSPSTSARISNAVFAAGTPQ